LKNTISEYENPDRELSPSYILAIKHFSLQDYGSPMAYPPIEYLETHLSDSLRIAGIYDDEGYSIEFIRDDLATEDAENRADKYVSFAQQDYRRAADSGALPYNHYHGDIRMFKEATLVHLPLEQKQYGLIFSLSPGRGENLRGLIRELHHTAYEREPPLFR
jgi:hypothetical protein